MKMYTNTPRKPMMCGGDSRKKRMSGTPEKQQGERRNPNGPTTVGSMQGATKGQEADQRIEEMMRMDIPTLRKIASGDPEASERSYARSALRRKGDKGAMPMGDQEPAGKMYGGKAKK